MATETAIHHGAGRISAEDFETASIRSAAPSYFSDAPSYHSTLPPHEAVPPYSPPAPAAPQQSSSRPPPSYSTPTPTTMSRVSSMLPPTPMTSTFTPGAGLPRIPSPRRRSEMPLSPPSLTELRQSSASASSSSSSSGGTSSTWARMHSRGHSNPQVRHYQSVANRRVAASSSPAVEGALRSAVGRIKANASGGVGGVGGGGGDGDASRVRPLEDPYLVGEEAAARARRDRLARQNGAGDDILVREDRRWDWFLAQMKDWDERDQGWTNFRSSVENGNRRKLARRIGR